MRTILTLVILAVAGCQPVQTRAPVAANPPTEAWVYRASEAADDTGGVYMTNPQGNRLSVECGNAGVATLSLTPDPRPADLRWIDNAVLWLRTDGGPERQLPATCGPSGCYQDAMLGGEPFPIAQISQIVGDLRRGSTVAVSLNGQVIQTYSLAGSTRALEAYRQAQGRFCDGL